MDINYEGLCNLLDGLGPGVDIIQKHLLVNDWNKNVSASYFLHLQIGTSGKFANL